MSAGRPVVLVAPDKFRSTATAWELMRAVENRLVGVAEVDALPLSDGGEGFLDAMGGTSIMVRARDPRGRWRSVEARVVQSGSGRLGVLESARIIGRDGWTPASSFEAVTASSAGVADAIYDLAQHGVDEILLGTGGSATSDGGQGLYDVLRERGGLPVPLTVATDIRATYHHACDYAAQKGVAESDLPLVARNLELVAARFERDTGVDVTLVERTGSAGGIAGALFACGAALEGGFERVASHAGLRDRVRRADVVVTGEGRLDEGSLDGKVVGSLLSLCDGPVLVICGSIDAVIAQRLEREYPVAVCVSMTDRVGVASLSQASSSFAEVVATELRSLGFVTDL